MAKRATTTSKRATAARTEPEEEVEEVTDDTGEAEAEELAVDDESRSDLQVVALHGAPFVVLQVFTWDGEDMAVVWNPSGRSTSVIKWSDLSPPVDEEDGEEA